MHRTPATLAAILTIMLFARMAAAATCAAPAFATPRHVAIAGVFSPDGFARGDFNGDGHLDVAAVYSSASANRQDLHVLLGDGSGSFATTTTALPENRHVLSLQAADVTGDADADLVASVYDRGYVVQEFSEQRPDPISACAD